MGFRIARGGSGSAVASSAVVYKARADISPGALLFADNCAACHESPEGFEGIYGTDRASLIRTIRDGGNNIMSMPAFADRMTDDEIELVTDYLRKRNNWD